MKRVLMTAAAVMISLAMATGAMAADLRIGVIDFQRVLKESRAGIAAQDEIKRKADELESGLRAKGEEIDALQKQLEREALVLSQEKRQEKERDIRIKINDAKTLQKTYRDDFKIFEVQLIKRIQKEFFDLVESIGKRDGYTMILEKVGVLYIQDSVDITDRLIAEYDRKRK